MKIYTKTGDQGETGLFGGQRVRKDNPRICAYGDVDELNSILGLVRAQNTNKEVDVWLHKIQNDLFDLGALLATPDKQKLEGKASCFIRDEDTKFLEETIDYLEKDLQPLAHFILPGGKTTGATLHLARTVSRRVERGIVALEKEKIEPEIVRYMNRLSDFLFVLARWVNAKEQAAETPWKKK